MTLQAARIRGDQVKCGNCPCTLGQIIPSDAGFALAASGEHYRSEAVPPAAAAAGIRSILVVPRRIHEHLERTGLPWTHRVALDAKGAARRAPDVYAVLPAIVPCWRPGCGVLNQVDTLMADA